MTLAKKLLLIPLALFLLAFLIAFIAPKEFSASSKIEINKPISEVYDFVKKVKNQDQFGVWQLMDPKMKTNSQGTDGTVGFVHNWEGEKVGKGSQTITQLVENKRVETSLDFGMGDPSTAYFDLKPINANQTEVTWGIQGETPIPWNLMNLFYNMDGDFERGLQNLKSVMEK